MKQLLAQDFTQQDFKYLLRLDKVDHAQTSASELFARVIDGRLIAWRFGAGILLTWVDGSVLWVEGMAGDQLAPKHKEHADEIKKLAQELGCIRIRCIVRDKTLLKLYTKRLDYVPVGTILEASI